jgi:hypothetical protein
MLTRHDFLVLWLDSDQFLYHTDNCLVQADCISAAQGMVLYPLGWHMKAVCRVVEEDLIDDLFMIANTVHDRPPCGPCSVLMLGVAEC